jgi:hypothetical protein
MTRPADRDGGLEHAGSGADPDGELLDTGPRRSGARTGVVSVVALAAIIAAAVLVAAQHRGGRHGRVAATASTSAPALVPTLPVPVPDTGEPPALMIGSTLYMVRDGSLIAHRAGTAAETSVTVGEPAETGGSYLLAADPTRSRIWVVKSLPARILIYAFDLAGLSELRRLHIEGKVAGVDVMRGELYLSTSAGVVGIAGPRSGLLDWTPLRGGRAIAADSTRNRLLLLDGDGAFARIRAESPDLTGPGISAELPFRTGTFMIVNGRIWAGGAGAHGAVLVRLDPRTLRPIRHSEVERRLGSGAVFAAAGTRSFLVRDTDGGGGLLCVDANSGRLLHAWSGVRGPVVISMQAGAATNRIYAPTSGTSLTPLDSGSCPG